MKDEETIYIQFMVFFVVLGVVDFGLLWFWFCYDFGFIFWVVFCCFVVVLFCFVVRFLVFWCG